jgi:hypothetical protein
LSRTLIAVHTPFPEPGEVALIRRSYAHHLRAVGAALVAAAALVLAAYLGPGGTGATVPGVTEAEAVEQPAERL